MVESQCLCMLSCTVLYCTVQYFPYEYKSRKFSIAKRSLNFLMIDYRFPKSLYFQKSDENSLQFPPWNQLEYSIHPLPCLMFDWMTSLCCSGWAWYEGFSRRRRRERRILSSWERLPVFWSVSKVEISPVLMIASTRYPNSSECTNFDRNIDTACLIPWTESTVSWNPWAVDLWPDLNSTQRLLLCPVRMSGCWVEEQLEKTVLDCPLSDLETVKVAEQSCGRESLGRMSRTLLVCPGETLHLHSPPVWAVVSTLAHLTLRTYWEVPGIVGGLHDPDSLLSVEGTGVALAHVQAGSPGVVRGGVGGAGPAGGLAPLGLVGTPWTLLTLSTVTVVHVPWLTRHWKKDIIIIDNS